MGNPASDSTSFHSAFAAARAETSSRNAGNTVPMDVLRHLADDWLVDCELRQHTPQTLYCRRDYLKKFFWFCERRGIQAVGTSELKEFFLYLTKGHQEPGGRWGNRLLTEPMRPVSMHGYYRVLRAWFNYLAEDEALSFNPMAKIKPPVVRHEVKQPIPAEHITALLAAARRSKYPRRDESLLLVLLDTGVRASELAGIKMKDLDLSSHSFRVLGKGQKYRTAYLGRAATKALSRYLRHEHRKPGEPVFLSERGAAFTASGLRQLLERLCECAGIPAVRCHAFRRTFAVEFLRNSRGSVFTCQALLGHSD